MPPAHSAGPAAVGPGASLVSVDPLPTQLAKEAAISKQTISFILWRESFTASIKYEHRTMLKKRASTHYWESVNSYTELLDQGQ